VTSIDNLLREANRRRRGRNAVEKKAIEARVQRVYDLYRAGYSTREIAASVQCSQSTVCRDLAQGHLRGI
jgi:transposase